VFKWAERVDKVFLTVLVKESRDVDIAFEPAGRLRLSALSEHDGLTYELDLELFGTILPDASRHVKHRDYIDIVLAKPKAAVPSRWFQLLKASKTHPQMKVDWGKYKDYDEELDEIEIRSGARGVPVPKGDAELKQAVDNYWKDKRIEERQKSAMPNLDDVTKAAEAEWEAGGKVGSFQDIVARKWRELNELRKRERRLEEEEDEWAGLSGGGGGAQDGAKTKDEV
jgi:hypothetical protein